MAPPARPLVSPPGSGGGTPDRRAGDRASAGMAQNSRCQREFVTTEGGGDNLRGSRCTLLGAMGILAETLLSPGLSEEAQGIAVQDALHNLLPVTGPPEHGRKPLQVGDGVHVGGGYLCPEPPVHVGADGDVVE